jgi:hypothetical protein
VRSSWQAKEYTRKLTVEEVAGRDIGKEAQSGNAVTRLRTRRVLGVQRIEDRTSGKHLGPNHRRRYDKDTLENATNREANQLGRHDKQPLVWFGKGPINREMEEASADETHILS